MSSKETSLNKVEFEFEFPKLTFFLQILATLVIFTKKNYLPTFFSKLKIMQFEI